MIAESFSPCNSKKLPFIKLEEEGKSIPTIKRGEKFRLKN